jgi:hypothetical protein
MDGAAGQGVAYFKLICTASCLHQLEIVTTTHVACPMLILILNLRSQLALFLRSTIVQYAVRYYYGRVHLFDSTFRIRFFKLSILRANEQL